VPAHLGWRVRNAVLVSARAGSLKRRMSGATCAASFRQPIIDG